MEGYALRNKGKAAVYLAASPLLDAPGFHPIHSLAVSGSDSGWWIANHHLMDTPVPATTISPAGQAGGAKEFRGRGRVWLSFKIEADTCMPEIRERLIHCFQAVFPDLSESEAAHATAQGVAGWDSVATVTLTAVVEEEFGT